MMYENQWKRWPDKLTNRVLYNAFALLLNVITGLPKSALRYQFTKRGLSMSEPSDVVLYLKELLWK
jgi:hypothetical protein